MVVNITIAVGLITAGATLAGGLIASITGLKIQARQLTEQNTQLEAERTDRHADERRALRREAYAQLLKKLDEVEHLSDSYWTPKIGIVGRILFKPIENPAEIVKALEELEAAANIISLEGPETAEAAAKNILKVITKNFTDLFADMSKSEGSSVELDDEGLQKLDNNAAALLEAKKAFIEAARKALE